MNQKSNFKARFPLNYFDLKIIIIILALNHFNLRPSFHKIQLFKSKLNKMNQKKTFYSKIFPLNYVDKILIPYLTFNSI